MSFDTRFDTYWVNEENKTAGLVSDVFQIFNWQHHISAPTDLHQNNQSPALQPMACLAPFFEELLGPQKHIVHLPGRGKNWFITFAGFHFLFQ